MENDQLMQLDLYNRMPVVIEGTSPQLSSESHLPTTFFRPGYPNDRMIGHPVGQSFDNLHHDKSVGNGELLNKEYFNYQDLCLRGSLFMDGGSAFFGSGSLDNSVVPQQEEASESLRAMYSSNVSYASSSAVPVPLSCGYDILGQWEQNRLAMQPELGWRTTSDMESVRLSGAQDGLAYGTLRSQNELGLSLATAGPPFPCPESIQEQCSDMGYSYIFDSSQPERRLRDKELSLGRASSSQSAQFSQAISGSKYRAVLQQILSQVASYSLDNVDPTNYSVGHLISSSSNVPFSDEFRDNDGSIEVPAGSSHRKQKLESKKSQLLSLLQVVDDQYSRCLDQIHTVISAFHAASELDPQLHACFALQSVSFFYKNLRQRISNQILEMGMDSEVGEDSRTSFEKSFIQKQWALQQLKKKDQQLWRPQRGLPEKSVSVLRAWMFDNFLHPYPKDAEKHLLAIKSGLSRSQVSNWFINARVRLWKPLVEEMCSELSRRNGNRQVEEGSNDRSSQLSIYDFNQRLDA
ncbi:homeobox protein ATH1 isoform X2 [Silene latifolia]